MRRLLLRLYNAVSSRHAENELARELASHLVLLEDEFRRRGMTADEARLAARRAIGGIELAKDLHRDARSFAWLEDVRSDVRYAVRTLARNPGFIAVAVLTLALGVGATTAIFGVVNAVLLKPLPYKDADRLVRIVNNVPAGESPTRRPFQNPSMTREQFPWWREKTKTLSHMAAHQPASMTLLTADGAVQLDGARVSPDLFGMLAVRPMLGRALNLSDERDDATVVVLGAAVWQKYFGSDPGIVNRTVVFDGKDHAVVGVMPADFDFPSRGIAFWVPFVVGPPVPGLVEQFCSAPSR